MLLTVSTQLTYMLLKRLHHIGIAVHDLDAAIALYRGTFGVTEWERIALPEQQMQVAVCHVGEQMLELLMPTSDQSPVARFLQTRGEGTHHLAYQVDDLQAALRSLEDKGVRLVDRHARPGIHGTKIAFIHPKAMQGVLVELVEERRQGGS